MKIMNKFKFFIAINLFLFFSACGAVKEGFTNQKKDNSDEFLVQKKSPLIMPPDYSELPSPKDNIEQNKNSKNEIKSLISENEIIKSDSLKNTNKSFEETMLEKIRNN